MRFYRSLAPALIGLVFCGGPAAAQNFNDTQRSDIEGIVHNYLITHPEVLEEAMNELSKRQAAADQAKHEAVIAQNTAAIFNSPRGVTLGNKDGDVTFVEFFDYNCGYCKRAMADMLDLLKTDSKLRVVLKEFPVLSQGSVEAAQVAVAVVLISGAILLSGMLFPIENMPRPLQVLSSAVPARYLVHALRGIMLKGSGWDLVGRDIGAMALFAAAVLAVATVRFQRRVA